MTGTPVSGEADPNSGRWRAGLLQVRLGDPDCREWRIAEVLDDQAQPTGQRIYHVTECNMSDRTS
jgi:hypothetical protein